MKEPYVMDNKFFLISLILVGLLAMIGVLLIPLLAIGVIVWYNRRKIYGSEKNR